MLIILHGLRINFKAYSDWTASYHMFRMIFHYTPYLSKRDAKSAIERFYGAKPKLRYGKFQQRLIMATYPLFRVVHSLAHLKD